MASKTNSCYLLLDVGGTFVKSGMAAGDGRLIPEGEFTVPMHSAGPREEILGTLTDAVRRGAAFAARTGMRLSGIGIAMPGPFDYRAGVSHMTHKFQSIEGVPLHEILCALPETGADMPVYFVHDVNAVLLGEMTYGAARGYSNVAVVTLGTGLGFALAVDGGVQYSDLGSPLVPIYNRPYREGILEDYASKRGFLRIFAEITGREPSPSLTVADIGRMAGEGNREALATFARVGGILACALRDICAEYKIECLLFGGQISRSFAYMAPALREGLDGLPGLSLVAPVEHIGEAAFYGMLSQLQD